MTDWMKQAQDMVKQWTDTQQKMWDNWVGTMQGVGLNPSSDTWQKSLDTWSDSVKKALDSQVAWAQFWADNMSANAGSSQQISDWSKQFVDMTKQWSDTQGQLWDNWFETLKKSDPSAMAKNWNPEEMQKMVQVWQEYAQKAMEAQMEMARMWTGKQEK